MHSAGNCGESTIDTEQDDDHYTRRGWVPCLAGHWWFRAYDVYGIEFGGWAMLTLGFLETYQWGLVALLVVLIGVFFVVRKKQGQ